MKKNLAFEKGKSIACLLQMVTLTVCFYGCSTEDNTFTDEGSGTLEFSIGGISEGSEETLTKAGAGSETVFVAPQADGLFLSGTMTADSGVSTRAGSPMAAGNQYRLVVYSGETIAGSVDGTAGGTVPRITGLAAGTYTVVAYSFNSTTLPAAGTSISVPAGTDLLYFSQTGVTVTSGGSTSVAVVFSHKFSSLSVVPDARALVLDPAYATTHDIGETVMAVTATISGSCPATMSVSDGNLTAGTATTANISWPAGGLGWQKIPPSNSIYIYTNGASSFTLTFTSITFGSGATFTNKSVVFNQAMSVGTKYCTWTTFRKLCGAYVMVGGQRSWKEFHCWNLGADTSLDPNDMEQTNAWGLNGAYIQWGKRGPDITGDSSVDWITADNDGPGGFAAAPTGSDSGAAAPSGWSYTFAGNYAWSTYDGAKTSNDPCPAGYRVPTYSEWDRLSQTNVTYWSGTWQANVTNYGSAIHCGVDGIKILTLPAAGFRIGGSLDYRGSKGHYWSSTESGASSVAWELSFSPGFVSMDGLQSRISGLSVRCVAE